MLAKIPSRLDSVVHAHFLENDLTFQYLTLYYLFLFVLFVSIESLTCLFNQFCRLLDCLKSCFDINGCVN